MSLIQTKAITLYTCTDGKQFEILGEAEAHQFAIENSEKIEKAVESYLNSRELKNRSRQQKKTIAADMYAFMLTWDGEEIARTVFDDEEVKPPVLAEDVPAASVEVEAVATSNAPVADEEDDLF